MRDRYKRAATTARRWASMTCLAAAASGAAIAGDWAQWRGPTQSGFTIEPGPVTTWSRSGENVVWKNQIGGRNTPIVMNGRIFVTTPVGEGVGLRERVVCVDAASGKTLWEDDFPVYHTDIVENRVGFTAIAGDVESNCIFVHTTGGDLVCYSADGKVIWKHSLTEEFGRVSGYGGRLHTPILDEGRVVISFTCSGWGEYAKPAHRYYAFDKKTGAAVWSAAPGGPPNDTSCGCPIVTVLGGRRVILAPNVDGSLYALDSRSGATIWKYAASKRPLNTMPAAQGDRVYISHSEENLDTTEMGALICIDGSKTGTLDKSAEIWRINGLEAGFAAPAIGNGRVYVLDNSANLFCVDAETGREVWKHKVGNLGKGSPVLTRDGLIYVGSQEEMGLFWVLKDAGDKCEVLDREEFPRTAEGLDEVLGSPSIVDGRLYFQTRYAMYCLGTAESAAAALRVPKTWMGLPPEKVGGKSFQLIPAEITLAPGQKTPLAWRWDEVTAEGEHRFSEVGELQLSAAMQEQFAKQAGKVEVVGVKGTLSGVASFTAAADQSFALGALKATSGDLTATARVRICPKPPFKVDFESMAVDSVPPGWINVINKTKIIEKDGGKVLRHLAERPAPPLMRLRMFMTPPIGGGYTISADVQAGTRKTPVREFWPDMGVVNTRYELLMIGDQPSHPMLRLVTWAPIPRIQKDIPFPWKPGVWYRMKFQVRFDGGKALLSGKVWPRDGQEPAAWTIEESDPFPNMEGAPGIYGYANGTTDKSKGAEVYWDNISVE